MPEDECQLAIAAFGNKRNGAQTCEVVCVGMTTHCGPEIELTLLTVPYILSVQPTSLCQESFDHISSLELADSSDGSTPMELSQPACWVGLLLEVDDWRHTTWCG